MKKLTRDEKLTAMGCLTIVSQFWEDRMILAAQGGRVQSERTAALMIQELEDTISAVSNLETED